MEKSSKRERWKNRKKIDWNMKGQFQSKISKNGAMSLGMIALVVCIVIIVNLIMGQLPEKIRNVDLTDNKLYEISDISKKLLTDLDHKVEIKVLADKSATDDRIKTFLSKYVAFSKKLDVEWIDPIQHPSVLTTYNTEANTIVVSCPDTDQSTTISFSDILVADEMSYYTTGSAEPTSFDGEGQLTGAINSVINQVTKTIYHTTGHGEGTLGTSVTDLLNKMNFKISDLNLLMDAAIPDDCDLLILYAPTTDLTEDEAESVGDYLKAGGNVYLIMGGTEKKLPNLEGIMKNYGLQMVDGYVADPDRCYQGNYYYIFPELSVSDQLADNLESQMVLLVNARGMTQTEDMDESLTVTPFMSSSANAHAVTEEGDKQGTYLLGAVTTQEIEGDNNKTENSSQEDTESSANNKKEARLTVLTSPAMIDDQITSAFSTLENLTLFTNTITANFDDVSNLAIQAKSLDVTYNTMSHVGIISLVVIFLIPLLVLIWGFMVWWRRRKA